MTVLLHLASPDCFIGSPHLVAHPVGSPATLVKDEFVFLMALVFQAQIKNTLHHIEDLITKVAGDPTFLTII
ncbi:hypothetical protein [Ktedonobacter sp. SOSP1-52]|uniref:hypothetical protein n=1 Tax=Ktedonobacter sp. SOSP1-52 TaxID=2778366 RepID=UPI001915C86E|nr:hypothetical protein [Ktedonobacter sp. SOSP1-52]